MDHRFHDMLDHCLIANRQKLFWDCMGKWPKPGS
jgi:hypothetical protein